VVTVVTLAIGICALYLALFAVLLVSALVAIPPSSLRRELGSASLGEYLRLAWLAASIATVGGLVRLLVERTSCKRLRNEEWKAADGGRTRDLKLGKLALYQLSYRRNAADSS
jgi:hypothetical protein